MLILSLVILTICPGAWLIFGLPLDLAWKQRLALSAALSPAILGVQLFLAGLSGLDFASAAVALFVVNMAALVILLRRTGIPKITRPRISSAFVAGAFLSVLLAVFLAIPWFTNPGYRIFSWHSLMHTDVIYQLTRGGLLPEEPEMAGLTLSYTWVGHAYWAVLGWMADLPPSSLYPVSNLIWLMITVFLAFKVASDGLGLRNGMALTSVSLLFLGTNVVGAGIRLVATDRHDWSSVLGDVRYTFLLRKYQGFETMPFAFALLLALTFVCLLAMRRKVEHLAALLTILLSALGLIYPILFPAGCLLAGGLLIILASGLAKGLPHYETRRLVQLAVGIAIGCVVLLAYLSLVVQDRSGASFQLLHRGRIAKSLNVIYALFPLALSALPAIWRGLRERRGPQMLLAVTAFCSACLYVLTTASQLEYKFILVATIVLAPLSAEGIGHVLSGRSRLRTAVAVAIPISLAALYVLFTFNSGVGMPANLQKAPQVAEDSFWIELKPADSDFGWTRAIHSSTPSDTVVIARKVPFHLGPFVARSLYIPSDSSGEVSAGYSMDNRFNLLEYRGYSPAVYEKRVRTVQGLFQEQEPARLAVVFDTLRALGRPLAIRFQRGEAPFALSWLQHERLGHELYADDRNIVWFVDSRGVSPNQAARQNQDHLEGRDYR